MSDRTVHADLNDGGQIVRYDRAGKWYLEMADPPYRRLLTLNEAVQFVARRDQWRPNRPGGLAFDRKVRAKFREEA